MKYHVFKDSPPGKKRHRDYGKYLYAGFLMFTLIACNVQPVMAATIWDKASEIMKDVYNQIISRMAQTNHHYLGYFEWAWIYHGLHHTILRRWKMEWITYRERSRHYGNT